MLFDAPLTFLFHPHVHRWLRFPNNCYLLLVCAHHNVSPACLWLVQGKHSTLDKALRDILFFNENETNGLSLPRTSEATWYRGSLSSWWLSSFRSVAKWWILILKLKFVFQLMVLFDVIHVVNTKSPEASDKSFLYTALEVFCLGEIFFRWSHHPATSEVSHKQKDFLRLFSNFSAFFLNVWWWNRIFIFHSASR